MARFLSLKALLISAGIFSTALALKVAVIPLVFEFSVSHVPLIWSSLIACLKPPYIYIIVNGIIISVVVSSRFNEKESDDSVQIASEFTFVESPEIHEQIGEVIVDEAKVIEAIRSVELEAENEDKLVILSNPICNPTVRKRLTEKPLVSCRFSHRKSSELNTEGGKAKQQETLENTWKAITEGTAMALSRHVKKCESNHGREIDVGEVYSPPVKKSETLKDKTNVQALTAVKLRKEPSLSQDELNRRVEDFISRFNQEMRLQREQSLNKYWDLVNH